MKDLCVLAKKAAFHAEALGVPDNIHLDDFIFQFLINNRSFRTYEDAVDYYFNDGRKSSILFSIVLKELGRPLDSSLSVLEFASGYGCVTRHLPIIMPHINFTACDIHEKAVQFISERLGRPAVLSHTDPSHFSLPQKYDVIFSLSFFSHMPRSSWGKWIKAHYDLLEPNGALIFTTQGVLSAKHIGDNIVIPEDGFWFKAQSEQLDLDVADYGLTLVTKEFVEKEVFKQIGRPIELYKEGFWWEHQDLYIVRKES